MKQVSWFTQESLRSKGIFMLDFDSDIFVWVGRDVSASTLIDSLQKVNQAARSVHSKGEKRLKKVSFNFVRQGFEPDVFKNAFSSWEPFAREGLDDEEISEEEEKSDSDSDSHSSDSAKE